MTPCLLDAIAEERYIMFINAVFDMNASTTIHEYISIGDVKCGEHFIVLFATLRNLPQFFFRLLDSKILIGRD